MKVAPPARMKSPALRTKLDWPAKAGAAHMASAAHFKAKETISCENLVGVAVKIIFTNISRVRLQGSMCGGNSCREK